MAMAFSRTPIIPFFMKATARMAFSMETVLSTLAIRPSTKASGSMTLLARANSTVKRMMACCVIQGPFLTWFLMVLARVSIEVIPWFLRGFGGMELLFTGSFLIIRASRIMWFLRGESKNLIVQSPFVHLVILRKSVLLKLHE